MKNILLSSVFVLFFIISACDAPRNNPVESLVIKPDTVKIEPIVKMIDGYAMSLDSSPTPISDVMVSLNRSQGVFSNNSGYYKLLNLEDADGWLYFENENYHTDSSRISWGDFDTLRVNISLDRVPILVNPTFYSVVELDHPDRKTGSLYFQTKILDDNANEISGLRLINQAHNYNQLLTANEFGIFEKFIHETDLNIDEIDGLIGEDFFLYVNYQNGSSYLVGAQQLKRVISTSVDYISPANNQVVQSSNPVLKWNRVEPGFSFYYKIKIYTNEINPTFFWQSENISSDVISHRVGTVIPDGNYYWVIFLVDEYGNSIRSKPASFVIEIPE